MRIADERQGFLYPFLGDQKAEDGAALEEVLREVRSSTRMKCEETIALRRRVWEDHLHDFEPAGKALADCFAHGGRAFLFGNGGSATDAGDMRCVLVSPPGAHRPNPAFALTDDAASITAVGNDVGFEYIFSRQIIALGRAGDVAIGFSTSGTSRSVVEALQMAKQMGLLTFAIAGYDGGKCVEMQREGVVDHLFVARSEHIPRIQEAHATVYHALCELVWTLQETK
ncbi:MAG: SIS domain-containing protein [Armatimonadetes bacterium]|nr:SIS domain-containing protein [Armatimonadota bacterium]